MKIEQISVSATTQLDPLQDLALKVLGMRNAQNLCAAMAHHSNASAFEQQEAVNFSRQNEQEVDALVSGVLRQSNRKSALFA